jgi:hypothetical protein
MAIETITLAVSPAEYQLVTTLRDMPESPLRDRVQRLLADLLAFARQPRCHELQADGVPCSSPEADCDQCQVVLGLLESLERRVPPSQVSSS